MAPSSIATPDEELSLNQPRLKRMSKTPDGTGRNGDNSGSTNALAEDRTDWAEDRTLLANERTFASWMRTGLTSAALGLGFHAVFKAVDPTWLARSVATLFVITALIIYALAYQKARRVGQRMNCHSVEPLSQRSLLAIALILSAATTALGLVLWIV